MLYDLEPKSYYKTYADNQGILSEEMYKTDFSIDSAYLNVIIPEAFTSVFPITAGDEGILCIGTVTSNVKGTF